MGTILRKWKWLIAGGLSLVFLVVILTYIAPPIISFGVDTIFRLRWSSTHSTPSPRWRVYTNSEYGYIVDFPSRPFDHPYELTNRAAISYHQIAAVLGEHNCFMVGTLLTSITNDFTKEQVNFLLDNAVNSVVGATDEMLAKRDVKLDGYMGKEIEIQRKGQYFRMRCYKVGQRLQELTVVAPVGAQYSTNIDHFFGSFRIISE